MFFNMFGRRREACEEVDDKSLTAGAGQRERMSISSCLILYYKLVIKHPAGYMLA